jgi:prepilin-type N-terminal cleavage/methylation domain-containing protein
MLCNVLVISRKKNFGFTLIEFIIVAAIVGIIMAAVLVNWSGFGINLNSQAYLLVQDLRYVQSIAMARDERFSFVKTSANSYQIINSSGVAVNMPYGGFVATLGTGIVFGAITNLPNNLITFDGKGVPYIDPSTPGTQLSTTATITITSNSGSSTVSIYPITGFISVQ